MHAPVLGARCGAEAGSALITGLVTKKGVISRPDASKIRSLFES